MTRPLIEFMGLEGFRSIVINVQKLLANAVFANLREAELKLMFDAQVDHHFILECYDILLKISSALLSLTHQIS